ncbi:MAG: hypothetical protein KJ950_06730 [Proteobacteria bacterium]|nr:hypothetical protein [Pseudomonadota bacterium]MBU1686853.1 hypothetical protein [Pseudomonadota bacterium]
MKRILQLFLIALGLCMLFAAESAADSAAGIINMDFDLSHQARDKQVELWIPYPVSSEDQEISGIMINGDFAESAVYADKQFQTPILYARWPEGVESRRLTLSFKAVRQEVIRKDFPLKETSWDPTDYALW